MAIYKIRDEVLLDIANAIREKLYTDKQYYPIQFADLIRSIETLNLRKVVNDISMSQHTHAITTIPNCIQAGGDVKIELITTASAIPPEGIGAINDINIVINTDARKDDVENV